MARGAAKTNINVATPVAFLNKTLCHEPRNSIPEMTSLSLRQRSNHLHLHQPCLLAHTPFSVSTFAFFFSFSIPIIMDLDFASWAHWGRGVAITQPQLDGFWHNHAFWRGVAVLCFAGIDAAQLGWRSEGDYIGVVCNDDDYE